MRFPISLARPPVVALAVATATALLVGCTAPRPGRRERPAEAAPRVTAPGGVTPIEGFAAAPGPSTVAPATITRPASQPPASAPIVRTGPIAGAPVAAPPPVVRTSGPEKSSDRGDRTLQPSPIGQLAPEAVPSLPPATPSAPPQAPVGPPRAPPAPKAPPDPKAPGTSR